MDSQYELIVQTANKLFQQHGIRNISIDQVCAELRISKKTFYTHFPQKEDLVDAIITYTKNAEYEKYDRNMKNKNAIDSLIFIIKEIKKNSECESHLLWHDMAKFYPKVFEKHDLHKRETIRAGFEKNLRQGIEEGYYRNDLDVELISLFHTVQIKNTFEMMQMSQKKYSKRRLLDFFIDLMIHLIANEKGLLYMQEHYLKDSEVEKDDRN